FMQQVASLFDSPPEWSSVFPAAHECSFTGAEERLGNLFREIRSQIPTLEPPENVGAPSLSADQPASFSITGVPGTGKSNLLAIFIAMQKAYAITITGDEGEERRREVIEFLEFSRKTGDEKWRALCASYAALKLRYLSPSQVC